MSKTYTLVWQWKDTKYTDSTVALTTTNKAIIDKTVEEIKGRAVNIVVTSYEN